MTSHKIQNCFPRHCPVLMDQDLCSMLSSQNRPVPWRIICVTFTNFTHLSHCRTWWGCIQVAVAMWARATARRARKKQNFELPRIRLPFWHQFIRKWKRILISFPNTVSQWYNFIWWQSDKRYRVCQGSWPLRSEKRAPGNTNTRWQLAWALNL